MTTTVEIVRVLRILGTSDPTRVEDGGFSWALRDSYEVLDTTKCPGHGRRGLLPVGCPEVDQSRTSHLDCRGRHDWAEDTLGVALVPRSDPVEVAQPPREDYRL